MELDANDAASFIEIFEAQIDEAAANAGYNVIFNNLEEYIEGSKQKEN